MEFPRLPRFHRANSARGFEITPRDREIIRLVAAHRFLRSSHICALIPGSAQQINRRLQSLYHHGFLERPRAQLEYFHRGGSRPIAYGLGNKGKQILSTEPGDAHYSLNWNEKNGSVKGIFLEHTLLVSDFMVALELASRQRGIRLLTEGELALKRWAFRWRVNIPERPRLGVVPDRTFGLEYLDSGGAVQRRHFFLEADRGTMPVARKNLLQTSIFRKLLAYEATWSQWIHRRRFGFHRFRVLIVTTSSARRDAILQSCSKLKSGHGLFLIAHRSIFEKPENILGPLWHTARKAQMSNLLD
jgi:hypothetical protein